LGAKGGQKKKKEGDKIEKGKRKSQVFNKRTEKSCTLVGGRKCKGTHCKERRTKAEKDVVPLN